LSDIMSSFPTFLLLVLLTWRAQQSLCNPTITRGEALEDATGTGQYECGFDDDDADIETRGFTSHPTQFWADAKINWQFVSIDDDYGRWGFFENDNIGLSEAEVDTAMEAMYQIEKKTCVRFDWISPQDLTKGEPWLLLFRTAKHDDLKSCQIDYIRRNLVGQDIRGHGDIFEWTKNPKFRCFGGASAGLGAASPQFLMISQTNLTHRPENAVGLMVHELLHNLGISHTQKRKDAKDHIKIYKKNIDPDRYYNYEPCTGSCTNYKTYGTPYDCSSIMHYGDTFFRTKKARRQRRKTMRAIDPSKCKLSSSGTNKLSKTDIDLINKMYCKA